MTFEHDTSTPTPRAAPSPVRSNFIPGELAQAFVRGVGRRLSRGSFVEPCIDALEHDFGFELGTSGRKLVMKRAVIALSRDVAARHDSPDSADDTYLRHGMFGSLVRQSSIAVISHALRTNRRDDIARAPYLFLSARLRLQRWRETSRFVGSTGQVELAMRNVLYGPCPTDRREVYADARFHEALGSVMLGAIESGTVGQAQCRAEHLLIEFDQALNDIQIRNASPPSAATASLVSMGAFAVDRMFNIDGLGFESALPVDMEPEVRLSQVVDDDEAWFGVALAQDEARRRLQALELVQRTLAEMSPQLREVCLQIYGYGLRHVDVARLLRLSTGTVGAYASQIRSAFGRKAFAASQPESMTKSEALSELLPPEAANRLVELICNGTLGGNTHTLT